MGEGAEGASLFSSGRQRKAKSLSACSYLAPLLLSTLPLRRRLDQVACAERRSCQRGQVMLAKLVPTRGQTSILFQLLADRFRALDGVQLQSRVWIFGDGGW
jgi:hypothetical protein